MTTQTESPDRKTRVFISYSRKNKRFARRLNDALDSSGLAAWVDWEGIAVASQWRNEIAEAVQASDAFIFIMSPDSIASKVCNEELEMGIKHNKKIIPVLYRSPLKKQTVHSVLSTTNRLYMRPGKDDFKAAIASLIDTIHTDLVWVKQHTRILERANEWLSKNRNASFLLQGTDLEEGERWMSQSAQSNSRAVDQIQAEYIITSRKVAQRRQRNLTIGIGFVMILSLIFGMIAIRQSSIAADNALRADNNAKQADSNAMTAVAFGQEAATQQAIAESRAEQILAKDNETKAQRSAAQAAIYKERASELDTSTLLALESWSRKQTGDAENVLRHNVTLLPDPVAKLGQASTIVNITVGADGQLFVTASEDGTACLWTIDGERRYCVGHQSAVTDAMLTPNGSILATAGADGMLNLWNAADGSPLKTFEAKSKIYDIDISPNNQYLASGRADGRISLIDLQSLREISSFSLSSGEIHVITFSPDSRYLAIGTKDGLVTAWRVATEFSYPAANHSADIFALAFSPDSQWIVSVGEDSTARVSRTQFGSTIHTLFHNDWVEDVAFGPDKSWFVTASDDNKARVFDTASGREKFRMSHNDFVLKADVSPDGQWIVTTSYDDTARIWEATNGTLMQEIMLDADGTAVEFSADGRRVITGDADGNIAIWDISTLNARDGYIEFTELIHKAKYSYNGEWVIVNTDDKHVWLIPTSQLTSLRDGTQGQKLLTFDNLTNQTKVSPDSKWIAITEPAATRAVLYNIETKVSHTLQHTADISGIGFSGDGKRFATTIQKGKSVYVWDVESGELIREIPFENTAFTIAFDPQDNTLAIGFPDKIAVWDVDNNRLIAELSQIGDIKSLNFSRNGKWLATTSSAGGISVWDMNQPSLPSKPAYTFLQDGSITSLDFNHTEQYLASGGSNGFAYIWDLSTGQEVARLPHNSSVKGVSFSPTEDQLLTVAIKTINVWNLEKVKLIQRENLEEIACAKLTRNFSTSEWAFFFNEDPYQVLCPNLDGEP